MGAPSPLTLPPEQQRKEMGVIDTEVAQEIEGALTPPSADKRLLFGAFFFYRYRCQCPLGQAI